MGVAAVGGESGHRGKRFKEALVSAVFFAREPLYEEANGTNPTGDLPNSGRIVLTPVLYAAVVCFPGVEPLWRFGEHRLLLRINDSGRYRRGDCRCDFILHGENIYKSRS